MTYEDKDNNPYQMALKQLDEIAKFLNLDQGIHKILAKPKRVLTVSLPYRWTMGVSKYFQDSGHNTTMHEVHLKGDKISSPGHY